MGIDQINANLIPEEESDVGSSVGHPDRRQYELRLPRQFHSRDRPALDDEQQQQHEDALRAHVDEVAGNLEKRDALTVDGELGDVNEVEEYAEIFETHGECEKQRDGVALDRERVELHRQEEQIGDEENQVELEDIVQLEGELVLERVDVFLLWVAVDEPDIVVDVDCPVVVAV